MAEKVRSCTCIDFSGIYFSSFGRSMTLEDIYRQIKDRETSEIEKESTNDMTSEEFEGEVTGFAVPVKNQNAPDRSGVSKISVSSYGNSVMGMGMSMGNVAMGGKRILHFFYKTQ